MADIMDNIQKYTQNSRTKIVFGWDEALNARKYINMMIEELHDYFYLGEEVFLLVAKPVMETEFYKKFIENLGSAKIFPYECQNPSITDLAEVFSSYRQNRQRVLISMGGGSMMDLAKTMAGWAYHPGFIPAFPFTSEGLPHYPLLMIPTIAGSGSEVSPYIIMTDKQGCKVTNGFVWPYLSIIDPHFSISSLHYQTLYAGLTAFAHAMESLVSTNGTDETDELAYKAIDLILHYLPSVLKSKDDKDGRTYISMASLLSGLSMKAGLGMTESMADQLHNLPHGLITALLLPAIIEFNYPVAWEKYERINNLFIYRHDNLADTIRSWFNYLGLYSFDGIYRKNLEAFLNSEYCIRLSTQLVLENIHYVTSPRKANHEEIKNLFFSLHTIPIQIQTGDPSLLY